ncbi:DUF11 domain-containing protein [Stackebrandtia nassauensis]|uniref:Conserved repeat domain protein n=1 Tax=Stackebrandtia nassauensis (strain DSM 44728 / CIP 108903 / NRRL B-16338 / NBRC 102104 / LLR-40K-21) TaxID=446470 RepID=D3Q5W1_STANL|nr:DUF11 domain-containing protein [Stackebrandtia nassauensis]ADD40260.1 conserved repeat domain protein [Stackebrandtia nassauensis DSM 44728]
MRAVRQNSRLRYLTAAVLTTAAAVLAPTVTATPASASEITPFKKVYDKAFYGDFQTVGNGVLDCPNDSTESDCRDTQAGNGNLNNNNFVMTNADMAGLGGFNSSSATATIPSGATVDYARLHWGGNNGKYGYASGTTRERCDSSANVVAKPDGSAKSTEVKVKVDGGSTTSVAPEVFNQSGNSVNGPHYYGAEADITSLFGSASGSTSVAVGDVWAPTGLGCVGGWSLTIVYKYTNPDPDTQDMHNFYIYSGLVVQRSADAPTDIGIDGFYATDGAASHASVTAYEGDRSTQGDRFLVNGKNIAEPGTNATKNFFNSSSDGAATPDNANNLNIDAKDFDLPSTAIPPGSTSAKLTLETSGDTYVAQQVAFAVPVPDLEVAKTSSPATVYAGDTVTYTVKIKNISNLDYPNAKFSDDLTDVLDDGTVGTPTATTGDAEFDSPKIKWTGDVAAGKTESVTYKVKVNDPISGDGKLVNNVVAPGSRPTTCDWHLTVKECKTSQPIKDSSDRPDSPTGKPSDRPGDKPGDTAGGPSNLSITGGSYTVPILIALALISAGVATLWYMRRRTRKAEE